MPPCPIISSFCLCHSLNNVKYATLNFFRFASLKDGSLIVILVFGNLILVSLAPWAFDNRENSAKKGNIAKFCDLTFALFFISAVSATCNCIPLWWTRGQHKVGTLRSQNTSWEDPSQVLQCWWDSESSPLGAKLQLLATFNYYNDAFGHPISKVHTHRINLCCFSSVIQGVTNLFIYNLQYLCVHLHSTTVEWDYAVVEWVSCICGCILSLINLYHNPH